MFKGVNKIDGDYFSQSFSFELHGALSGSPPAPRLRVRRTVPVNTQICRMCHRDIDELRGVH